MRKTKVTLEPIEAKDVRSGSYIRVSSHEPTARVVSAGPATANGAPCYMLTLDYGADTYQTYVGHDHTVWLVTKEEILVEGMTNGVSQAEG